MRSTASAAGVPDCKCRCLHATAPKCQQKRSPGPARLLSLLSVCARQREFEAPQWRTGEQAPPALTRRVATSRIPGWTRMEAVMTVRPVIGACVLLLSISAPALPQPPAASFEQAGVAAAWVAPISFAISRTTSAQRSYLPPSACHPLPPARLQVRSWPPSRRRSFNSLERRARPASRWRRSSAADVPERSRRSDSDRGSPFHQRVLAGFF